MIKATSIRRKFRLDKYVGMTSSIYKIQNPKNCSYGH